MASTPYQTTDATPGNAGVEFLNFQFNLASIANGTLISAFPIPFNYKIQGLIATVVTPATTASKTTTLTVQIGSTTVTGISLVLTSANMTPGGVSVASYATDILSGGNNVGVGSLATPGSVSIVAGSTTAFVEGVVSISIILKSLDDTQ